jgi:TPR repeat protein
MAKISGAGLLAWALFMAAAGAQADTQDDMHQARMAYITGHFADAAQHYQAAADTGLPEAQYDLAWLYRDGQGVAQHYGDANRWYRKAAVQGYTPAQYGLGTMYRDGLGVAIDLIEAHMWFNVAAEGGDLAARQARDELSRYMSTPEIVRAQDLAKHWLAANPKAQVAPN